MRLERTLLLLLPLALAACESSQPSYSASNTNSPPPAPAAQPVAPPPPAPAEQAPAAAPPAAPVAGPRIAMAPVSRAQWQHTPSAQGIRLPPPETVGVAGCDDYVARYRACLTSDQDGLVVPVQRKYQLAQALARQVRKWNIDIKSGKSGEVAQACTQASSEARETLGKLGCKTI